MRRHPRPEAATPQPRLRLEPEGKAGAAVDLAQGLLTGPLGQEQAADPCGFRAGDDCRGQAQLLRTTEVGLNLSVQLVHQTRDHFDATGGLDLFDQTLNKDVLALATLGDSLGIRQMAHRLFRLGTVETLSYGLERDGVVLRLVLTL